ncbi:hypothetical protein OUZ56_001146 [Daphnia magna]|uniref:Secreted protein n=1 Tax=Daphnia magna TaxID=35525 RepID=A0ABR0A1S2_9CRUS|nr:hypothetical protein OUZ56_001146 [Daphnia magna]
MGPSSSNAFICFLSVVQCRLCCGLRLLTPLANQHAWILMPSSGHEGTRGIPDGDDPRTPSTLKYGFAILIHLVWRSHHRLRVGIYSTSMASPYSGEAITGCAFRVGIVGAAVVLAPPNLASFAFVIHRHSYFGERA